MFFRIFLLKTEDANFEHLFLVMNIVMILLCSVQLKRVRMRIQKLRILPQLCVQQSFGTFLTFFLTYLYGRNFDPGIGKEPFQRHNSTLFPGFSAPSLSVLFALHIKPSVSFTPKVSFFKPVSFLHVLGLFPLLSLYPPPPRTPCQNIYVPAQISDIITSCHSCF